MSGEMLTISKDLICINNFPFFAFNSYENSLVLLPLAFEHIFFNGK